MFGRGVLKSLKVIDFYKQVPSEYSEGTLSGACISVVSITALVVLSISAVANYMTPMVSTDLIMDIRHSEDPIKYSLYHAGSLSTSASPASPAPCSLLIPKISSRFTTSTSGMGSPS